MLAHFTAIYEKGEKYYIGYCPEIPGANGQGETIEECRESLKEAIKLILQDRLEDALWGIPDDAIREKVVIE
jgi:predicted RNase H-like HicB family nuclease